jgi:phosphate-selective porin
MSGVASAQGASDTPAGTFRWDEHPAFRFGADTQIELRARVAGELRRAPSIRDDDDASALDLARRRVGVAGEIAGLFEFQVERELNDNEPWRDVYLDYRQFDAVRVQGGKFKLPLSLDENTSAANLDFVYRSMAASALAPGRARGLMLHGRVTRRLRYEAGLFEDDGNNGDRRGRDNAVVGRGTWAGRLRIEPFRGASRLIRSTEVGVAMTRSDVPEGVTGIRGRTQLGATFFPAYLWVNGTRQRIGVEARWSEGPISMSTEYLQLTDERKGQSVGGTDLPSLVAAGWYVTATAVVTGEDKEDVGSPANPLFRGGIGSVEIGARFEQLRFGSRSGSDAPSISPRAEVVARNHNRAGTLGVTWRPNRWIKIQANLIRDTIAGSLHDTSLRRTSWSRVALFSFAI